MCSEIPQSDSVRPNSVLVYENMGEWFVIVVRDGKENVASFELESFANAYAEGQRLGLGLGKSAEAPGHGSP
jgi:hypothetical protein